MIKEYRYMMHKKDVQLIPLDRYADENFARNDYYVI